LTTAPEAGKNPHKKNVFPPAARNLAGNEGPV
jgi:hypothetical protein